MSVQPRLLFRVRGMRTADLPDVLVIERGSYDYPWNERVFLDCLRVGYHAYVATDLDQVVVGYGLLSAAMGESHVLNLCVASSTRGHGVAGLILDAMIAQAEALRADVMLLEVRPSNKSARRLYKRYGFYRVATRPGYYPAGDGREDALLLSRRLDIR